jgi:hypothetical protein
MPDYIDAGSGTPTVFTIEGSNLRVALSDDTALTFDYYAENGSCLRLAQLAVTNHPDAYLFGTLCEANAFNKDVDAAGTVEGQAR